MRHHCSSVDQIEQQLQNLFRTVFPDLSVEELRHASANSVKSWDSVTAITLLTLIEEEFGIQIDFRGDIDRLTSFMSIAEYLRENCPSVPLQANSASLRPDAKTEPRAATTGGNGSTRQVNALSPPRV